MFPLVGIGKAATGQKALKARYESYDPEMDLYVIEISPPPPFFVFFCHIYPRKEGGKFELVTFASLGVIYSWLNYSLGTIEISLLSSENNIYIIYFTHIYKDSMWQIHFHKHISQHINFCNLFA